MNHDNMKANRPRDFAQGGAAGASAANPPHRAQPMQPVAVPRNWARLILTMGAPGVLLFILLGVTQLVLPYDWKPSVLVGKAIATYEVTILRGTVMDRSQAEQQISEARAEGERAAELAFQEKLKEVELAYNVELQETQARLQSGVEAYKSLYDRANMIQQAVYQMEGTMLQFRQQAIRDTQSGNAFIANAADIGCIFLPEFCQIGNHIRSDMADQLTQAGRQGAGSLSRDLLQGLPDPAQFQGQLLTPSEQQER